MTHKAQQPTEEIDGDTTRLDHPAFGQIGASRVTGSTTLYGSDFEHQHFVSITIRRSQLNRDLSRDWHYGREELIEVHLSEAQWATFVSSMNVGSGVPCTLSHVDREFMPGIPLRVQKVVFDQEVGQGLAGLTRHVDEAIAEVEGEIGQALNKTKRGRILDRLRQLRRTVAENLPFVAKQFDEHMEDTVEHAKIEVNAYVQSMVARAGLMALEGSQGPLRLPSGKATGSPKRVCPECGEEEISRRPKHRTGPTTDIYLCENAHEWE